MSCMDRLSQIASLAKSKKVTDYKKAIKQLLEFWDDNSEITLQPITEYSRDPTPNERYDFYSWNDIFIIVHELFINEIDRISKLSGNAGKLDKERVTTLVFRTSEKANYYLKPKDVVNSTLQLLRYGSLHIFSEYYEIYLHILRKYVLQERSQRILLASKHWQELLNMCVSILQKIIPNVDYAKLLETIELIVKYGCDLSTLLFETRNLLPVIANILENYEPYKIKSADILFKLTFTVCQQIATDSRLTLCKFSESIPLSMIDIKGPEEKYQLYLLFVQVHHPKGAILGKDGSYAYDNEKWKAILNLLYKMILNDLRSVLLSENFTLLACEVFRQKLLTNLPCFSHTNTFHDSIYIQPRKKRRISDDQDKMIDLINDRDPKKAWPMIQITAALYKKYPDCLKFEEFVEFLETIIKLMKEACKTFAIMENLCELATVLVQNENTYNNKDSLQIYWDKIWDAALRYISMTHEDVIQKGCLLVQNLISHKKISNPNALLKLYLTKSIQWSSLSILTLKILCEYIVLPNEIKDCDMNSTLLTNNSLKLQLMQWVLNTPTRRLTDPLSIEEFSKTLIGLTLKSWYKAHDYGFQDHFKKYYIDLDHNLYDDQKTITINDIERCYLSVNFETKLLVNNDSNKDTPLLNENNLDNPYIVEDLDFLIHNLMQMVQAEDSDKELSSFITKTSIIANIISNLQAMNMIQCNFDEFCLVNELKTCLSKIFDQIININWSKNIRITLEITKALISLYQTKYDVKVKDIILTSTQFQNLKKIYDISKIEIDEFEPNTKSSLCIINSITVLALYSCLDADGEISELQMKIASTLLKLKKYSLSIKVDVICVVTMLEIYSNIPNSVVTEEFGELLMTFVMDVFQSWHKDDKVNRCLLYFVPNILKKLVYIDENNVHIHNVLTICKLYQEKFTKGVFGQMTHLSLVQCLNNIVKHTVFHNTGIEVLTYDVFTNFVNSCNYLVRLECLNVIDSIFSNTNLSNTWKSEFFEKLNKTVYDVFLMQRQLSEDEIQEERLLRSTSAMQVLATVICSKSTFQGPALFTLARIIVDKDIEPSIVKKTLQIINASNPSTKCIVEENLNYILTAWCRVASFGKFPHGLLNCSTEMDFYDRYARAIFPVLLREGKMQEAKSFCERLGVTFEQIFKTCSANILPWALSDEAAKTLEQMQNNQGNFEGIGKLGSIIKENLQHIIVQLVQRLHDLRHFYKVFDSTIDLPESDPPHFKAEVIDACFDRLIRIINSDPRQSVFACIILRKPSIFQKILLQLTRNVYTSKISQYKAKAFHQYIYFCSKIAVELNESYCDAVATYFVRDIGCTLLNLTKEKDSFITKLACKYMHKFFKGILPRRGAQVSNILSLCVKTLIPMIQDAKETSPLAKDILVLLLKERRECLAEAIERLGTLSSFLRSSEDDDNPESQVLRENLKHFLSASENKSCSVDDLIALKRQLSSKREELEELYSELETCQGFAEHCARSVLHRLVYQLIRLTESPDTRISLEAAKCLGLLGPADLCTMILHPQETQQRELIDKANMLTHKVCWMLSEFVLSDDIELRSVSSEVFYVVLDSTWGARVGIDECADSVENVAFLREFLKPFRSSQKGHDANKVTKPQIDAVELERVFDPQNPLWSEASNDSYNKWLSTITSEVARCLDNFYSKSLIPVFQLSVQFCELTLQRLVSLLIDVNSSLAKRICHCVNRFFEHHFKDDRIDDQTLSPSTPPQMLQGCKARDAIRCMLIVVNHLRIQTREQVTLDFDYLSIAMAAQFCSAYFSSVLYTELWCRSTLKLARDFDSIPIIDQIYEQENRQGRIAQDILKEAYMKIGDSDSIHGCGSSHLHNHGSRIPYYTNFQKLDKLILSHDVELSINSSSARGMVTALRESSLHHLAKRLLLSSTSMQVDPMDDLCYDSLWRLSDWSQIMSFKASQSSSKENDFSKSHYEALKCLHENDNSSLQKNLEQAYFCVIKDLCNISLESCRAVYPKLSQLQMLREIEELSSSHSDDYEILLANWKKQQYIYNSNFQYIEPILSQRAVMFKIREPIKSSPIIKDALIDVHLETARLAQQQGHINVAARSLETLSKVDLNNESGNRLLYHEALLAWTRKDEDMARFNLRTLIKKDSIKPNLLARALRIYGNWIAENKSENPQAIINKYYKKAIDTYESIPTKLIQDELRDNCKARAALAQFAHEQYLVITEYMKSPQFESLMECLDYSRNAVLQKAPNKNDRDVERAVQINTRQSSNDSIEIENIQKDKAMYLAIAVENYLSTLQDSDEHDFLVFRLVSLWLDNTHDAQVNKRLENKLALIPSYKFIPLIPQLAPHMNDNDQVFSLKISQLLERCARDHPHHTLPVLLALKNLYNDSKYCGKKTVNEEPRVLGAQHLIQKLLSTDIRPIIQEMERLSDALVMLAYYESEKKAVSKCIIPRNQALNNIKDFQHSIIPSITISIKKNGKYNNIVSVRKYESSFGNVGGINAPKKIICTGTDGIARPQLVKGKDDLRQDAVMQQVFTVMNSLLRTKKDAKQRKLYVRTYKVMPLTQRSGVLEWCENTLPLSIILTGDGSPKAGLHQKYYPSDYTPNECRKRLCNAKTAQQKYSTFMDCCKNLHPAFHHFFTENYLSPETWFERRLAYTRSVATTSIIGYILGLGDRHVSNILLDKSTAEVIHIDFGIAFEQGKVLPTPETVPFRLTRDMEVAMGVSGVEGTMRRCCEETMTVLREQREIIVTLLRVLLYDPLYSWAITPAKAATYQSEHSSRSSENKDSNSSGTTETNKLAERALLRVQQKLQGIEEGVTSSIAGQVERLIQQARDPTNLCKLFQGWQAYL
ncbi:hypothetical protein TSAR_000011 [Trichomalopsis sarcophagae]|uniref:Serine/threonine-protein kinase ATM n=1 Tax=Trichomalopsis sarcophagae TaxID=543379 RepID=A0A232F3D5_9HYME|nr:hypothetical protein TSAR_000011 [Trichomalopsis sarcophagae]